MARGTPFIDWLTIRQTHYREQPLPFFFKGVRSYTDASGVCLFEKACAQSFRGSWDSNINIQCDGSVVLVSGNVGRFGRPDNVFNYRWGETLEALDRICDAVPIPRFGAFDISECGQDQGQGRSHAIVSRIDLTKNFRTGSDAQARAFIRHLSTISLSRCKRGIAGDESVWWVNTRRMVKAYNKADDLLRLGHDRCSPLVGWCRDNGIVRIEVELKNRLLSDLKMQRMENITDEKLAAIYDEETSFLSRFDSSDEPDVLANIPARSRAYAAAWLGGQDLRQFVSRATLYRHAKVLAEYGLHIIEPRNISTFPTKVRVIELEAVEAPDWYEWNKKEAA